MEHFCSTSHTSHVRPIGRCCYTTAMATNITSKQATAAANALLTQQVVSRHPSPIQTGPSGSSVNGNTSTTVITSTNSQPQHSNPRTDELILAELQKLSARMSQVEQELHTDTFTSTPRKRKRVAPNRQASDSSLFGITNRTEANTSLDESMAQSRGPEGIQIPVHTHSTTNTTSTSTASLFAQSSQARIQQNIQTISSKIRDIQPQLKY